MSNGGFIATPNYSDIRRLEKYIESLSRRIDELEFRLGVTPDE